MNRKIDVISLINEALQKAASQHKAQLKAASEMQIQELKNQFEAQRVQYETQAK